MHKVLVLDGTKKEVREQPARWLCLDYWIKGKEPDQLIPFFLQNAKLSGIQKFACIPSEIAF